MIAGYSTRFVSNEIAFPGNLTQSEIRAVKRNRRPRRCNVSNLRSRGQVEIADQRPHPKVTSQRSDSGERCDGVGPVPLSFEQDAQPCQRIIRVIGD